MKNKLVNILKKSKKIISNNVISKKRFEKSKENARTKYKNDFPISIISANCIAGEIYNLLGLRFDSPTINCSFNRRDFVDFCLNLDYYLNIKPSAYVSKQNVIILTLDGDNNHKTIEISFPHDDDLETVIKNWEKRKQRINYKYIFIICDDRGLNEGDLVRLNMAKSYKTIIFTSKKFPIKNTYYVKKYRHKKCVGKYNVKKIKGTYGFQDFFDYVDWLNVKQK